MIDTDYREATHRAGRFARAAVALSLALAVFLGHFAAARAAPIVVVNGEAGFGGFVKPGGWTPVRVTVSNTGDSVDADIVLTSSDSENSFRTSAGTSLPRGGRRSLTLYAAPGFTNLKIDVVSDGKLLATTAPAARPLSEGDRLSLAVSEPLDSFNFLGEGRTPAGGRNYVAQMRVDQLPAVSSAYDSVDTMVFNNVDTSQLSTAQRDALRAWLVSGGQLILGGGPGAQLTAAGFADILPAQVDGALLNIQSPRSVMAEVARPNSVALTPTAALTATDEALAPASQLRLTAGDARVLASGAGLPTQGGAAAGGDYPLVVRRELGRGVLDQLAFDPSVGAWAATTDARIARRDFFNALTGGRIDVVPSFGALKSDVFAHTASRAMPVSVLPPVPLIALFLAAYVLAIGPLNFLLLRRFRRLEWAWVTLPALITAFTLVGAAMGVRTRGNDPRMHRLTVISGDSRVAAMRLNLVSGVFSPRRIATDVEVGSSLGKPIVIPDSAGAVARNPVTLEVADPNRFENVVVENNDVKSFYSAGNASGPSVSAALRLVPATRDEYAKLAGEIRNTSNAELRDCVLTAGHDYLALGNLEPGAGLALEMRLLQGVPQSNFTVGSRFGSPTFRAYTSSRNAFGTAPRSSQPPSAVSTRNASFDLIGPSAFSALIGWRTSPDRFGADAEQNLIMSLYDDTMRVADGVSLACWEYADHSGASVSGATYIDRGARIWRLPVANMLFDSGTLPPDVFSWRVTNGSGASQFIGDGLTFDQGRHVIAFTPWLNVRTNALTNTLNLSIDPSVNTTESQRRGTNALVYDWQARTFTPATTRGLSPTNQLRLTGPYVSPAGEVRLRFDTGNSGFTLNNLALSVDAGS